MKDIVNSLSRLLRKGAAVYLSLASVGKIVFENQDINARFSNSFLSSLNEDIMVECKERYLDKTNF